MECGFKWKSGDEPVPATICVQPDVGHGDRHVSKDGSWILVEIIQTGAFGQPVAVPVAADYAVD